MADIRAHALGVRTSSIWNVTPHPTDARSRPHSLVDELFLAVLSAAVGACAAPAALPRARSGTAILAAGEPVEVDRKGHRDGIVCLAGGRYQIGFALAGRTITLRLDGHLMHAIADDALMGTWPCPVPAD
ncbi:helix-turn-helix domain-containing protein, partial [Streptomyces sp. NPDC005132]